MVTKDDDANLSADERRREVVAILATGARRWHRRAKATGLVAGTGTLVPPAEHQEENRSGLELGEQAGLSVSDRTAR